MTTIRKSETWSDRVWPRKAGRPVIQLCAVIVVVLAMNFVLSLRAAPSIPGFTPAAELTTQAAMIDRTLKRNRASAVVPTIKLVIPSGCELPFSTLVKRAGADLVARCLT